MGEADGTSYEGTATMFTKPEGWRLRMKRSALLVVVLAIGLALGLTGGWIASGDAQTKALPTPAVPPPPSTGQEPWSHAHASTITPTLRVQSSMFFHDVLRTGGEPNGRARVWWQCVGSAVQFFHPRLRPALARAPGYGYCPFCPCGYPLVLFPGVAHSSLVHY